MTTLFDPARFGSLELKNRIVMAPLTRGRAGPSRLPNALMAEYYGQRAGAGLIVSEATAISGIGYGWAGAPALYTDDQAKAWRLTTDAVHGQGGKIVLQLWHMGRVSHPDFHDGAIPVAPSAIAAVGMANTPSGKKPYVTPRPLNVHDIKSTLRDYAAAAKRAVHDAGFDGVEIHAANSYLIDQFIRDGSNRRTDEYGGAIDNRLRFMREVIETVIKEIGADKTGIRLSPSTDYNSMTDSDPAATFTRAAETLNDYNLAYLHIREAQTEKSIAPMMREVFKNAVILNDSQTRETAENALKTRVADAVAFGKPFIANPDLVQRLKTGAPLNELDTTSLYSGGSEGYTDYPFLKHT